MARLDFRGGAAKCTLSASLGLGILTATLVGDTTGWPTGAASRNFVATIDRGVAGKMEKVLCSAMAGQVLTIATRGYDGTAAVVHDAGATVEHSLSASLLDDLSARLYENFPKAGLIAGTTDASAQLVVTHGAAFTPTVVIAQLKTPNTGAQLGYPAVTAISATTFTLKFVPTVGTMITTAVTGYYVCHP